MRDKIRSELGDDQCCPLCCYDGLWYDNIEHHIDMVEELICKIIAPLWSSTPPALPGWYWWRGLLPDRGGTFMVEVVERKIDGIQMIFHGFLSEREIFDIDAGRNAEWCGPITPPL